MLFLTFSVLIANPKKLLYIEPGFFLTTSKRKRKKMPNKQVDNDSFAYTKFDFTVDEGKERLNPSRENK